MLTLTGGNSITIDVGTTYIDAGATCVDAFDGSIVPTSNSIVNTAVLGSYTVTYNCVDSNINHIRVRRTVIVVDICAYKEAQYNSQCLTACDAACVELKRDYKVNC